MQLGGVTSLPLHPTFAFGDMIPLLHEPQRPAGYSHVSSSQFRAFQPLPFNSKCATTDVHNGCPLGMNNMFLVCFFINVLGLFLKNEVDSFHAA